MSLVFNGVVFLFTDWVASNNQDDCYQNVFVIFGQHLYYLYRVQGRWENVCYSHDTQSIVFAIMVIILIYYCYEYLISVLIMHYLNNDLESPVI